MAVLDLRFKRFRSFITILGVTIGIGSIYLLLSFGIGLQQLVQDQVVDNKTINTIDVSAGDSKVVTLTDDSFSQIKSINHVTGVSGVYTLAGSLVSDTSSTDTVIYGVESQYLELTSLNIAAGASLDMTRTDQAIINSTLVQLVGLDDSKSAIGKSITLTIDLPGSKVLKKELQIVGVFNSGGGSEVFIPKAVLSKTGGLKYSSDKVVVDNRDNIAEVRQQIESFGYATTSPVDTIDQINQAFRFFNLVLVSLGSIGMVIAGLGMINTLTVSLLERTREIGLMMAVGARPKDVRRLFIAEAVILSLTGGVTGIIIATIISVIVNTLLNQAASSRAVGKVFSVFAYSPLLISGIILLMIVIGLLVAFIPARRASKINPIIALREE
jgi:putative ABC transport system permease protein